MKWNANKRRLAALMAGLLLGATAQAADTTLNYWSMWNQNEPQGKVIEATIKDFEAANPGTTVKVNWLGRQVKKLVLPALDSKSDIDVFDTGAEWLVNQGKYLLPLDSYLKQPSLDNPKQTVAQSLNNVLLNQYKSDGKTVSLVYQPFAVLFFYNKDHFAKAGINAEPKTWDEFLAASEKLKKAGFEPITTDIDAYLDIILGYYSERYAGGCDLLQRTLKDKSGKLWSDASYLKMAQSISELNAKGYIAKGTSGNRYPAGQQRLALGEVSMYLNGTWLPSEVKATTGPDFKWGSFSFPAVTGGKGKITSVMMGSQGLAIPKSSKHPDLAFKFIKYMVNKKTQQGMVEGGVTAARTDVAWLPPLEEAGKAVSEAKQAIGWACDLGNGGEVVDNVVMPAFTDLFVGKSSPDVFVRRLQDETAAFWKTRR